MSTSNPKAENEEIRSKTRKISENLQKEESMGFIPTIVVHMLLILLIFVNLMIN